jgi:hypothetical protein
LPAIQTGQLLVFQAEFLLATITPADALQAIAVFIPYALKKYLVCNNFVHYVVQ